MDIYTAVEHTPDGSNLMLATNHDDNWLQDVVAKAGYSKTGETIASLFTLGRGQTKTLRND